MTIAKLRYKPSQQISLKPALDRHPQISSVGLQADRLDQRLANIPGKAMYEALVAFESEPDFPIHRLVIRDLARNRAAQDSRIAPWTPAQTIAFEQTTYSQPVGSKELQQLALRRLKTFNTSF